MTQSIVQVDAFSNKPFGGNPAAICIMEQAGEAEWMQKIAAENNLAETAFLYKQDDGYNLRWFTPALEVDLCGHATLATAHVLWEEGHLQSHEQARFYTRSGLLTADRKGDWIELNFPAIPVETIEAPAELLEALGLVSAKFVGKGSFDYLVEVESEAIVYDLKPNFAQLEKIKTRGVTVTSKADATDYAVVSRFFAPAAGINEDPVTGSAHCYLATYWSAKLGKSDFTAYQASARGGIVKVSLDGDRVRLGGQAVTVLRGELLV